MVRILYGVAGEGSGHSTRAKEIIAHLIEKGHEIKVVSCGKGYKNLSLTFDVLEVTGPGFVLRNNKLRNIETFLKNLKNTPKMASSLTKVLKLVSKFKPQIIFSDFEPFSAMCANLKKIPLISIDNQRFITGTKIEYPKKYRKEAFLAKTIIRLMVPNADKYLTLTFANTKIINKRVELFPPILRKEVLDQQSSKGDYILVYLTSEFLDILEILKNIPRHFVIYGFNKNNVDKNLTFKVASQNGFLGDLANCQGVIANSGFSLISESLYLGKPYLAIPLENHFEQIINAYYLEKLGYGKYWDKLNKEGVELFISNLDLYAEHITHYQKTDNSKILERLDGIIEEYA